MDDVPDGRHEGGAVDRDLIEAAQRGDQSAFVDLVRSRGDRLFGIAQHMLRDFDRAEDALQDALVIAWRDLPSLRDPDRFDGWMHKVLTNVCIAQALTVVDIGGRTVVIQSYGPTDAAGFDRTMEPIRAIIESFVMCGPGIGYGPCSGPGAPPPTSPSGSVGP